MLHFLADENFNLRIIRGLFRVAPDFDLVTVQDVGLVGTTDPAVLDWAAREGRIVLTHDVTTMTRFARDRVRDGEAMPGLFLLASQFPIGAAIEEILLIVECSAEEEWESQIVHLPLR